MLGDLEAFERFLVPLIDGMFPFPVLGYIFYSALLIMMPILLVNLLVNNCTRSAVGGMHQLGCNFNF